MASVNIRVNDEDKKACEDIFLQLGLTLSSATNAFYKQVIRHRGLPFDLTLDGKSQNELEKAIKELKDGKTTQWSSLDEFKKGMSV